MPQDDSRAEVLNSQLVPQPKLIHTAKKVEAVLTKQPLVQMLEIQLRAVERLMMSQQDHDAAHESKMETILTSPPPAKSPTMAQHIKEGWKGRVRRFDSADWCIDAHQNGKFAAQLGHFSKRERAKAQVEKDARALSSLNPRQAMHAGTSVRSAKYMKSMAQYNNDDDMVWCPYGDGCAESPRCYDEVLQTYASRQERDRLHFRIKSTPHDRTRFFLREKQWTVTVVKAIVRQKSYEGDATEQFGIRRSSPLASP